MPVFRVEKVKDYTIMPNTHLRNRQLSLRAKGLLCQMLSLSPKGIKKNLQSLCFCLLKIWSNGMPGNGSLRTAVSHFFIMYNKILLTIFYSVLQ